MIALLFSAAIVISMSGCTATYKADPRLVAKFRPAVVPDEDETLVYVIRGSAFKGGARKVWVGCNEKILASLASGTYAYFVVDSGITTVNFVQMTIPFAFHRLDDRGGKTVFLYYEYNKGALEEVGRDLGATMVMKTKHMKPVSTSKKNDGYGLSLANPGFVDLYLMKKAETLARPDAGHAVITFIRPRKFVGELPFGIWDKDGFLGNLKGQTFFQVAVPPGKHTFLGKAEHWTVLQADVEAGKEYYVEVTVVRGWAMAHLRIMPVKREDLGSAQGWMKGSEPMTLDEDAIDETVKERLDKGLSYVRTGLEKAAAGEIESRYLESSDGM